MRGRLGTDRRDRAGGGDAHLPRRNANRRRYVLYLVDASPIAVIAHSIDTGNTPVNQLNFGTSGVKENFAEESALFVVDRLVKSTVNQLNNTVISFSDLASFVSAFENILTVLRRAIALTTATIPAGSGEV